MNTELITQYLTEIAMVTIWVLLLIRVWNKPQYPTYDEFEAIEFAEWIADNDWIRSSNDLWYWQSDGIPDEGITTVELYKRFKEQLNENS